MKEKVKEVAVFVSMLIGLLLMMGGEGGIVQGSLGNGGWWVMLTGLVMLAAPVLWAVWMQGKEDEDDQDQVD